MATQAYYDWDRAGRRYTVCTPVANTVYLAKKHGVAVLGTIGNEEHLRDDYPQDHTPYSATAWPLPLPGPVVTACDLADGAHVDRIIADAMSGRAPWIKYINARGWQWNVKNSWVPIRNSDKHCHLSARTDRLTWWDPTWNPFVEDEDMNLNDSVPNTASTGHVKDRTVGVILADLWKNSHLRDADVAKTVNEISRVPVSVDGTSVATALLADDRFMDQLAEKIVAKLSERIRE